MRLNVIFGVVLFIFFSKAGAEKNNLKYGFDIILSSVESIASRYELHEDTGLNIEDFLTKYGYVLENNHIVQTIDDYILTLHRIPTGRNEQVGESAGIEKPTVLLVHGIAGSAMDWVFTGPDSSLALILADLGYDVWLANLRGNLHTSHKTLTTADSSFWDFTFHEKGYYDLPEIIDYILEETGLERLSMVAHSEGTTAGLVLTSTRPEYNRKLNLMALLSPMAYMGNSTSPLMKIYSQYDSIIKLVLNVLGVHGVSYTPLISLLANVFCNDDSSLQILCIAGMSLYSGFDVNQLNTSLISVLFSNTPSGVSVNELDHYAQESVSGYFRQYDYGDLANLFHYGSTTPPAYDIDKITVPLALYYAQNDFLSSISDVDKLVFQLADDTADRYLIDYEYFNNLDFLLAKDIRKLLYDRLISVIREFNPLPPLTKYHYND